MKNKNKAHNLNTSQIPTWCPGCSNFIILSVFKKTLAKLEKENNLSRNCVVLVADIGCGAKIYNYLNINAVCALHGRVLPVATGIKIANPHLTVICFSGDGGAYSEGMNHLIHTARRDIDITMIVANNEVFALTKGQPTFMDKDNLINTSLNATKIARAAGAKLTNKISVFNQKKLEESLIKGIIHKGFSLIEIMQPCLIFQKKSVK